MTSSQPRETPPPKIPDHPAENPVPHGREAKIDRQMKDTFPASDPPSYSGGNHAIGAPTGRESPPATPQTPEVAAAEHKVKRGGVKSDKY